MAKDPYKYFRVEANEIIAELAKGLGELEHAADAALVARLLRHAHTLKGAARIVRHRELADLAHALETALAPLRETPVAQRNDAAIAIVDQMTGHLAGLAAPVAPAAGLAEVVAPVPPPPARVETAAVDEALGGLAHVHARVERVRAAADARARNAELAAVDRELREVRRDVEHLRLSSAAALFAALDRTARDAAAPSGKRVRFGLEGGDVRIDGQVIATLHGALVQLVRNAVVHGIEPATERTTTGKPAEGRVTIAVRSLDRRISIACSDDGRGLDLAAIRRAAEQRGVLPAGELGAAQLFQVLLRGGISTSPEVTELAGRGIGLDVVREAVHTLGGEVAITTGAAGTTISLVVPVSVTAVAVLDVDLGDRIVAIPRAAVRRVVRIREGDVIRSGDSDALCFDDVTAPCASLAALFGARVGARPTAVVVDGGDGFAALTVERVLGVDDAIVRALPAGAPIDAIVWGMAIDAAGLPYPVVEPRALVAAATRARRVEPAPAAKLAPILIVDDSLTTRMLEQSILESAGFAVELAVSAEDALAKLAHTTYALLLVDVEMPGMDGFGLVAELRAHPATAQVPAILVTSRDAPADRRRGAAVGAQGYVVKGEFDQGALLAMIERLVQP
jgi:two-component system chemotaxis sensor kinase CheA